jgi:hypothetical protein
MSLRLRAFPDRGALVWFALLAGIFAWMTHLVGFAIIVAFVDKHGYFWLFYLGNAVTIAITLFAGWLCYLMVKAGNDDESAGTPGGRIRFLGYLGLLLNGANLLLILLEGTYIFFIRTGG